MHELICIINHHVCALFRFSFLQQVISLDDPLNRWSIKFNILTDLLYIENKGNESCLRGNNHSTGLSMILELHLCNNFH